MTFSKLCIHTHKETALHTYCYYYRVNELRATQCSNDKLDLTNDSDSVLFIQHSSPAVEIPTFNRGSLGLNPPCLPF